MKNFKSSFAKMRSMMFLVAITISIILLLTYHLLLYFINLDLKDKESAIIDHQTEITWQIIENIVNNSMQVSKSNLEENVIPTIVSDINSKYGDDKETLESDIKLLPDISYDNPLVHIFANNIRGKYFDDIKSDSNDMFVLMKGVGIISDMSISSSSYDYRSINNEIQTQYNKDLAKLAFNSLLQPAYDKGVIFWQANAPMYNEHSEDMINVMNLDELKRKFKDSNGDIEILQSYDFLVPGYIFMDKDILGNQLVDDRGNRQDIYQFIVVQGFNVYQIVKNDSVFSNIFDDSHIKDIQDNVRMLDRVQQLFAFLGFIVTIFLLQVVLNRKYNK